MPQQKYIPLFFDYLDAIEPLGDAERGRLFTALLTFGRSGAAPELSGNERFVFPVMRTQMARHLQAYERKCQLNGENARLGGIQKQANAAERYRSLPSDSEAAHNKNNNNNEDKNKNENKDNAPARAGVCVSGESVLETERFEEFWERYPKKRNRPQAQKVWESLEVGEALFERLLAALESHRASVQWANEGGRYVPNADRWLAERRWENALEPSEQKTPPQGGGRVADEYERASVDRAREFMRHGGGDGEDCEARIM